MHSLRLRLLVLLSLALGLAWLAAAWFTHLESREEINRLFDAQLSQSAQVLLSTTRHDLHERVEHGEDHVAIHAYEQKVLFQIWNANTLLLRSAAAPLTPISSAKAGYSETLLSGQSWRVLTRWDAREEFMIQVAEPMAGRESLAQHITYKLLLPTFIVLPVLLLLLWLGISAGLRPLQALKKEIKQRTPKNLEAVAMVGVPDEVSPLVGALNDLFVRLEQAFNSERRFTADAAHELRTPLAALKIQAQVALRSSDAKERQAALENVLRGVDRAARLIEQLLSLARVDPETAAAHFQALNLHVLAASAIQDLAQMAHTKHIELSLEGESTSMVLGDATQISLLLRNLLDNAIRYTPMAGRVSVVIAQGVGVELQIRDSGPGIPAAEREQVWQRFYRIAGSGEEGSGLGLSIVQRIAALHNAQLVLADHEHGQGLLVKVIWPAMAG
ncbi:MAG: sensor histidine kinase N-terminal domain-containing protein [Methylotenera sp.]|nr:sensor histidine kinase N-terminal domain-containing protein [Methylotenera sp.]